MPYPIIEIEVTQLLPTLSFSEGDTGVALLVRRKGKPIAFWLEALPANSVLTPAKLTQRISEKASAELLSEGIHEERLPPVQPSHIPSVTIAICTKDRPENLARCLKSLQQRHPISFNATPSLEILVIDNAPSDERTRELVSRVSEVRYVCEPKPGLDFARNRALREAKGELLAFLDDDVTIDRGWLAGLLEAWAENPDAAAFTGQVLPYELETEAQILFEQRGGFRRGFDKIRYGQTLPGDTSYPCQAWIFGTGANMAFRRSILVDLGGFDEALDIGAPLPGGGDLDLFYRVIRAGYPLVYEPQYLVFHQHRREIKALRRQYERSWGRGFMAFLIKSYQTDPSYRSKLCWLVVWWLGEHLWKLQKSLRGRYALPPSMILAELWGGIVGLLGEYSRSLKRVEEIRRQF
jgi:GT2 family glycosyltransferase